MCKKIRTKELQKRSFCTAIPIVLHGKSYRFAMQSLSF